MRVWSRSSKKPRNISRIASLSAFPRIGNPSIIGVPMKVYGSSVESPQVSRVGSRVQK